jgi:HEAT repeat protein
MVGCASQSDELVTDPPPVQGQTLTTGQQVLNVITFPFRMVGYGLYYSFKFIFYDIWAALIEGIFGGGDDEVSALIRRLKDEDPAVRMDAAFALGYTESPEAPEALLPLLADSDAGVGAATVHSLGRIGKDRVEKAVVSHLNEHASAEVRARAARVLGLLRAEGAAWALMGGLKEPSWKVRAEAAMALGRIGSWTAGPALAEALRDEDPRVRGAAALALGSMGDVQAVPYLRNLFDRLEKEGTFVRAAIITSLADLDARDLIDPLLAIAKGEGPVSDPHSRAAAFWALGRMQARQSLPVLTSVLLAGREPLKVLEGAAIGLGRMGGKSPLESATRSEEVPVRAAAVNGLIALGGETARRLLLPLVRDPYTDVRQRAILALLVLGDKDAVVHMIDQLRSPDPEIRAWAFLELKRISRKDLGLNPADWLSWWEEAREAWDLRRHYTASERTGP